MTREEILSNLCCYDERNPDCVFDKDEIKLHKEVMQHPNYRCYCDNCFYGRTKLANYIIELLKKKQPI